MKYQALIKELIENKKRLQRLEWDGSPLLWDEATDESLSIALAETWTLVELTALANDQNTHTLDIKIFLYERWQLMKAKKIYSYHEWPYSPVNEICIKLAQAINRYGWIQLIMPDEHPHQTTNGLTQKDLYTFDTTQHTPLYYAIKDDNVELLEDYIRVAGINILEKPCGPEAYHTPMTLAAMCSNVKTLAKILEIAGADRLYIEYPLHHLARYHLATDRQGVADILINAGGVRFLNAKGYEHSDFPRETVLDVALKDEKSYDFAAFLMAKNETVVKITDNLMKAVNVDWDVCKALTERHDIARLEDKKYRYDGTVSNEHITQETLNKLLTEASSFKLSQGIKNLVLNGALADSSNHITVFYSLSKAGGVSLNALLKQRILFGTRSYDELLHILAPADHTTPKMIVLYARCFFKNADGYGNFADDFYKIRDEVMKELDSLDTIETISKVDKLRLEILKIQKFARDKPSYIFYLHLDEKYRSLPNELRGPLIAPPTPEETPTSKNVPYANIFK
jgi:hypothetical protein